MTTYRVLIDPYGKKVRIHVSDRYVGTHIYALPIPLAERLAAQLTLAVEFVQKHTPPDLSKFPDIIVTDAEEGL